MPMQKVMLSNIQTPDGKRWYFSHHAKQRMKLYGISYEEAVDLLMNGAAYHAQTAKDVYKVYNKRLEMVVNNELERIITIYKRV
jgi:hypothetical protein